MSEKDLSTFCPLPWLHSFVNIGGEHQVCCTSEEYDNNIRDNEGNRINIESGMSTMEIMNTDFMNSVRNQMLDGKWPNFCKRCLVTEKTGGTSRRQIEIINYKRFEDTLISETNDSGQYFGPIVSADYRLGNVCNLQCRMCGPRSTKLWLKDWNEFQLSGEKLDQEFLDRYSKYDWIDKQCLEDNFVEKISGLEHLHFAGGEPLVAKKMATILQKAVDEGVSKNITVTYNTNLSILPPKVLELWKHFKEVKLLVSIDAYGKLNDYIRMKSDFNVIDKNLRFLNDNMSAYSVSEILLSSTVQAYNILKLDELFDYLQTGLDNIIASPNFISLHGPDYLRTQVLPKNLKELAQSRIEKLIPRVRRALPESFQYMASNLEGQIEFMNALDLSRLYPRFLLYSKAIDAKYGQSIKEVLPELFVRGNHVSQDHQEHTSPML